MLLIVILIIIFFLVAYYLASQTTNNNIAIQQYIQKTDPTYHPNSRFILCVLKYGLGNRMNCLSSSIILSRYLNIPLYVVWTDVDMGDTQLSDIWAPPYPFTVLDAIPPGVNLSGLNHGYQHKLFNDDHIRQLIDKYDPLLSNGVTDLKLYDIPIIILSTYWNFKHADQSLTDFYTERAKIFSQDLIPTAPINERIQRYRSLCNSNTLGVHIRLTDSCTVLWGSQAKCEILANIIKKKIQTLLDADPQRTVFLCTDDQSYINDLITKYGSRIIVPEEIFRFSIEGQQEAYAEMMALSYCSPLLLSLRSTFSAEVASLADTEECMFYSPYGEYRCK